MTGRVHVKPDHILDFIDEGGIAGFLERSQAMRLNAVHLPDALHGAQTDARGLGHGPPGPMRGAARRLRAGQRQHLGYRFQRYGRLARLACLVAKKAIHSLFGVALLPAPYGRAADPAQARNVENRALFSGVKNNLSPLAMLLQAVAILNDRRQARCKRR